MKSLFCSGVDVKVFGVVARQKSLGLEYAMVLSFKGFFSLKGIA